MARVVLPVHGLSCGGGGALTAERAIARTPGVLRAYVNPATEMAYVEYDPAATTPTEFARAVARVGLRAGEPVTR
ncbi:MAG: heavy-metal-associated domain-containing protein [Chloroflexota bacterium]